MVLIGSILKRGIKLRNKIVPERMAHFEHQEKVLIKLLRKAEYTEFGIRYKFTAILNSYDPVKEFTSRVPAHNYESIWNNWWQKSHQSIPNVSWPGKVNYFALSSGTSQSASKHIPVTDDMVKAIRKSGVKQIFTLSNFDLPDSFYTKGILMLGGSTRLDRRGDYYEGDLSGITTSKLPFWFQSFYKPGKKISAEKDWGNKLEEITQNAPDWDIGCICGVPAWVQLLLEKIIDRYNLKNIHEIWPGFQVYTHGGVSFDPYRKSFQKLLGKEVIFIDAYIASEGFIAFQPSPDHSSMRLVLNNGIFYEFVPFNSANFDEDGELKDEFEAVTIRDVEPNRDYALLLSSCAGAWRYLIGDTVRFTSRERAELIITGRTKHFLSLCGEHLSVDNMNKAIELVSNELNFLTREFTVSGIPHETLFAHKWYIGVDGHCDPEAIRNLLDEKLKILNDDYRVERTAALKEIFVEVVPMHIFYDWMKIRGKEGGQNKFPRVMKQKQFSEWETFVKERLSISNKEAVG